MSFDSLKLKDPTLKLSPLQKKYYDFKTVLGVVMGAAIITPAKEKKYAVWKYI